MELQSQKTAKNLKIMLPQFSRNISSQKIQESSADLMNLEFQKSIVNAFGDIRLSGINPENFENPTTFIVHIILNGTGVQLQAIAKKLSLKACINRPSLASHKSNQYLKEGEIIKIIAKLIYDLSKYFEVNTTKIIEQLIWFVYENYKHFSLEDLILFCQNCKERRYATPYQHINAKGVNAEFFQLWLEEYERQRKQERIRITNEFRNQFFTIEGKPKQFWEATTDKFGNAINENKKRKSKLRELRFTHKKQEDEKPEMEKLQSFIVSDILRFEFEHHSKSKADLLKIADQKMADLIKNWKDEFNSTIKQSPSKKLNEKNEEEITEDSFQNALTPSGEYQRIRIPALTFEKYLSAKIRQFIYLVSKKQEDISALDIMRNGLAQLIKEKNISAGHQLITALYPEYTQQTNESIASAQNRIIIRTQKMMLNDFKKYEDRIVNGEARFLYKKKYCLRWAWAWICKRCFSKISNPKNILS